MSTARYPARTRSSVAVATALLTILVAACIGGPALLAATKAEKTKAAHELVKEALHREIYGQNNERGKLLDSAKQLAPDFAPAMWHSGHVRVRNSWVKATDVPDRLGSDRRLELYELQRGKIEDTAVAHLALADWCRKMKLVDRERAHLTRVLELDADNATARSRLGFRRVDGRWVDTGQLVRAAGEARENAQTFKRWVGKLEGIRRGLDGNRLQKETATARLMEIRDPAAVPAIEALLSTLNETAALTSIKSLADMHAHEADLALARMAVFSQWPAVRRSAAEILKNRPLENFVPDLLTAMYSPVRSAWRLYEGRGGRLMFRQVYQRDGQDGTQQLVMETGYRRISQAGGDRTDTLVRALSDVEEKGVTRSVLEIQQNLATQQLNDRIMEVLVLITNEQVPPQPQAWWQWWDEYNEVFRPNVKQVDRRYRYEEITLVDRAPAGAAQGTGGGGTTGGAQRCDCLGAGTKVWTDLGPKTIEEIQVGDLVLSQAPDTGELAYKPVLRLTVRPASQLVTLHAGGEAITTSGGHLFWVAGEGWVRARETNVGTELHAIDGAVQLSTVETASFEPSYNIIVADFHTYFVGDKKPVLCHDNTVSQKTDAVVPGLIDR